jgi:hypothetical protein
MLTACARSSCRRHAAFLASSQRRIICGGLPVSASRRRARRSCPRHRGLFPLRPISLLCVGEAALACDPITGDGIVRALRSGIFASYAIADWLRRGEARGLARYRLMLQREFTTYRELRRDYYAHERRWPDSPFWWRRNGRCPPSPTELARRCAS